MTWKPAPPPPQCQTAEQHERKLCELAELLEAKARSLLEGDQRVGISAGRETANVAIRARRQAAELAQAREAREHDTWVVREYQRMNGLADERPRLKRKQNP